MPGDNRDAYFFSLRLAPEDQGRCYAALFHPFTESIAAEQMTAFSGDRYCSEKPHSGGEGYPKRG